MDRTGQAMETRDAKGMLVTALVGVITALLLNDFVYRDCNGTDDPVASCSGADDTYNVLGDGLAGTVASFVVPIVAVVVLLKVLGYV